MKKANKVVILCMSALIGATCLYYVNIPQVKDKGEWVKLQDSQRINGWLRVGDKIYGGDFDLDDLHYFAPLKGVDAESFKVCKNSDYAKDKNCVYYPIVEIYRDAETWGGSHLVEYIVDGASPNSFKYVGGGYGVDGYSMYYHGVKIKWDNTVIDNYQ